MASEEGWGRPCWEPRRGWDVRKERQARPDSSLEQLSGGEARGCVGGEEEGEMFCFQEGRIFSHHIQTLAHRLGSQMAPEEDTGCPGQAHQDEHKAAQVFSLSPPRQVPWVFSACSAWHLHHQPHCSGHVT